MKKLNQYIIALIMVCNYYAVAQNAMETRGPLSVRNQFPIGLQFLSFHAEDAFNESKGNLRLSLTYDHSNTFVMSKGALEGISSTTGRTGYQPNGSDAKSYFIDTGTGRFNWNMQYGLIQNITLGIDLPVIFYQGGVLDAPIELFHNEFGIDNYSRSLLEINQSQFHLNSSQKSHYENGGYGLGDIVISAKINTYQSCQRNFIISLLAALKLPAGNYKKLTGSGSIDYGFNLLSTNMWTRHILTNNFGVVIPGSWKLFPDLQLKANYNWMIGYEYYVNSAWSFIFQHRILSSPLSLSEYPDAGKPSYEWTSGAKIDLLKNIRLSLGITQNYINHENVPDFGLHLGAQINF